MAKKTSGNKENKTGVAEKAAAAEIETAAAEQAETATENGKQPSADSATANTGVNNETVTAGSEAEIETAASETGGASNETDDSTGETDGADGEDGDSEKEKQEPKTGTGFQFNVSAYGLVGVISEKRAGKSVTGATGEIITFDDKGYAEVKLEDAMHFSQVPGFSFK